MCQDIKLLIISEKKDGCLGCLKQRTGTESHEIESKGYGLARFQSTLKSKRIWFYLVGQQRLQIHSNMKQNFGKPSQVMVYEIQTR